MGWRGGSGGRGTAEQRMRTEALQRAPEVDSALCACVGVGGDRSFAAAASLAGLVLDADQVLTSAFSFFY